MNFNERKLSRSSLNARSMLSERDLKLLDKRVRYILNQISSGIISKQEALKEAHNKTLRKRTDKLDFVSFLMLKDLLRD